MPYLLIAPLHIRKRKGLCIAHGFFEARLLAASSTMQSSLPKTSRALDGQVHIEHLRDLHWRLLSYLPGGPLSARYGGCDVFHGGSVAACLRRGALGS
mmetsp:Transcript_124035/g.214712  ORF Transcript_124035/g.214712 Transcript_124035/m.214712 type:complete len:98 (+) Transcript_124035:140-433(+)